MPQDKLNRHTKESQQEPAPTPRRREEEETAPRLQKEKPPNTKTGTTRECGLQLKHLRLATVGERERRRDRRSKKATPKGKPRNKSENS